MDGKDVVGLEFGTREMLAEFDLHSLHAGWGCCCVVFNLVYGLLKLFFVPKF